MTLPLRDYLCSLMRPSEADYILDALERYIDDRLQEQRRRLHQEWQDPNRSTVLSGPCHVCGSRDYHAIDCPQNLERVR
jgi:hypothetical protein